MLRSAVRSVTRNFLSTQFKMAPLYNMEQVRNTVVVERMYPTQLAKRGQMPRIRPRNMVYKFVDRVHDKKTPNISCILTGFVEGVGVRGEQVLVKRSLFRNKLYPAGLAVYATPDNLAMFAEEKKTLKQLAGLYLRVHMSGDNSWLLNTTHVKVALRRVGVEGVEVGEECISLPREPITQPGEFTFQITVNGVKSATVKGCIILRHNDPAKDEFVPLPKLWQPCVRTWKARNASDSADPTPSRTVRIPLPRDVGVNVPLYSRTVWIPVPRDVGVNVTFYSWTVRIALSRDVGVNVALYSQAEWISVPRDVGVNVALYSRTVWIPHMLV
ncbi:hypothetical protein BaRGS_00035543 [Batillaria attramentaria]|uniref:Large ribosomal subunit protein bL9m n=1 Tax=Batillaria attramentaria TaxID=370345 RepID=A0ABD0JEE9_9CAEN